ncbi:cation diffusion facilitator family transporter [Burkholderia pyrrocinia]|uniref:cation diffusion facilitator family transporter n=1 Tax=Burkholderia pyrrocinia TaxID=60550 RepID=UPI0035C6784B
MTSKNSDEFPEIVAEATPAAAVAATRSTWVSVAVNLVLSIGQVAIGVLSRSQGLVADGIHSLSDLLADFVVLLASHHSRKPVDAKHPYGHQRFETGASLALALILLLVGGGMLWSAIQKLEHPEAIQRVHAVALWVAVIALIAKESLFRYMLAVATRVKSSMLVANAWHARSDAASSLVVGFGIVGNLLGYPLLDPIAALIVGGMIVKMGATFGWDALHDLMDRSADAKDVQAILATLRTTPGVLDAHDLRTRKTGDLILVDVHLDIDADLTVAQGHDIAVDARARVMRHHRVLNVMTHVDPRKRESVTEIASEIRGA